MKKEVLTMEKIASDLKIMASFHTGVVTEMWQMFIIPVVMIGILLGFLFGRVWIAVLISSFSIYHIVQHVRVSKELKAEKKRIAEALQRSDIAISVERFSHTAEHTVYEPHVGRLVGGRASTRTVLYFHFHSGPSWRPPTVSKHYAWSRDYYLSPEGLENIAVDGNEYYYVSLQGYPDIAYIYPCKFFELDGALTKREAAKDSPEA